MWGGGGQILGYVEGCGGAGGAGGGGETLFLVLFNKGPSYLKAHYPLSNIHVRYANSLQARGTVLCLYH